MKLNLNSDSTIFCPICKKEIDMYMFISHIKTEHEMSSKEFAISAFNVPTARDNLANSDFFVLAELRKLYPQFKTDTEIIQYIYDNNGCSCEKLDEVFGYTRFGKMLRYFGINFKRTRSAEQRKSVSEARKGMTFSEEHKKNMSASITKKWENNELGKGSGKYRNE